MRILFLLVSLSLSASCRHSASSSVASVPGSSYPIPEITEFYPEPLTCDAWHSKEYPCDGYTQKNLPSGPGSANPTAEIETSSAPPSGYVGLQQLGGFDASKPTVIYIHGWNVEDPTHVFGLPDQWVQQARLAGFNVMQYHWASQSFDKGAGCPGLGAVGIGNVPCNVALQYFKKGGQSDDFLRAYKEQFTGYKKPVRLIFQSLAGSFGFYVAYRMYLRPDFDAVQKPTRLDAIDPFVMAGFGEDRSVPYNGQIPPDDTLPDEYRQNIVRNFVPNSGCRTTGNFLIKANYLSQYCQTEGMAYRLIKDFQVGIFTLSSIVGGATARDLRRVSAHQAFSGWAFSGRLTTRHTAPNASYFYSFAPGEPAHGLDASTADEVILELSKKQVATGSFTTRMQTAGTDTITLMDDAYRLEE